MCGVGPDCYHRHMTNHEIALDRFYADFTDALMIDALDHADEIGRSVPDPDTAPDPEFAHMSAQERDDTLDDIAREDAAEAVQREWMQRNRWSSAW